MDDGHRPFAQSIRTRRGSAIAGNRGGFDFLGYRLKYGRRFVRKKSLQAFKDRVRAKTGRSRGASMERIVADLNPMLRGSSNYFKHVAPSDLRLLDAFIRRRLR